MTRNRDQRYEISVSKSHPGFNLPLYLSKLDSATDIRINSLIAQYLNLNHYLNLDRVARNGFPSFSFPSTAVVSQTPLVP
mmetsp:Transcript_27479/g.64443  ORF Transcript_27479/g.64443 Transcript_27479/m.64443 type:complete len:80 (+) Transcript_27479:124-363(+)